MLRFGEIDWVEGFESEEEVKDKGKREYPHILEEWSSSSPKRQRVGEISTHHYRTLETKEEREEADFLFYSEKYFERKDWRAESDWDYLEE